MNTRKQKKELLQTTKINKNMKMYGIEYGTSEHCSTYEIFETYNKALSFANRNENSLYMFKADFNENFIYKESDYWNYEDNSELYTNLKMVKY